MRKLILTTAALLTFGVCAEMKAQSAQLQTTTQQGNPKQSNGTLAKLTTADAGIMTDKDGMDYEFDRRGAAVDLVVGEEYTYIKVVTPSGKVIIRDIRKPN